jgi:hypothetical protein
VGQKLLRAYWRKLQLNPHNNPYDPPFQTHGPNSTCKLAAPATQRSVQETFFIGYAMKKVLSLFSISLAHGGSEFGFSY